MHAARRIGDHKQLRPKIESYELSVASRKGYDLNMSLFERLVEHSRLPHATLGVQHRMHPQISALIKHTYPDLKDHPSVEARPEVKGLASRLVFLDHREPELQESKGTAGMWGASASYLSKVRES